VKVTVTQGNHKGNEHASRSKKAGNRRETTSRITTRKLAGPWRVKLKRAGGLKNFIGRRGWSTNWTEPMPAPRQEGFKEVRKARVEKEKHRASLGKRGEHRLW